MIRRSLVLALALTLAACGGGSADDDAGAMPVERSTAPALAAVGIRG